MVLGHQELLQVIVVLFPFGSADLQSLRSTPPETHHMDVNGNESHGRSVLNTKKIFEQCNIVVFVVPSNDS